LAVEIILQRTIQQRRLYKTHFSCFLERGCLISQRQPLCKGHRILDLRNGAYYPRSTTHYNLGTVFIVISTGKDNEI